MGRMRVKMCGMSRVDDVNYAIEMGVDALGFIFYEKSMRHITLEVAQKLLYDIPPFVTPVAVLVNPDVDFVWHLLSESPIQMLQFHGDEDPEFCELFNTPYIKATHPQSTQQINAVIEQYHAAKAILFDTPSTTMRGGSGTAFDWAMIPKKLSKPYILAGGLNEFNIKEAIKICTPCAVDVCSGIEAVPGIKDHVKMRRFTEALWDVNYE